MKRFWAFYAIVPVLFSVMLLATGFASSSAAAPGIRTADDILFSAPSDAPDPNQTLKLVNQVRSANGLAILHPDEALGRVAQSRALDMAERQYYAHKSPDGTYYFDSFPAHNIRAGYNCENLDLVFVPDQELVIREWMQSLHGHRECMMSAVTTHAGYATAKLTLVNVDGSQTTAYLVVAIHAHLPARD